MSYQHPLKQQLERFATLPANWDSYNGNPIAQEAITEAIQIIDLLEDLALDERIRVNVYPLATGGVQLDLDYKQELGTVEIEVDPVGYSNVYFFNPTNELVDSCHKVDVQTIENFLLGHEA